MARYYNTQEVVDILMQSDSEDLPSSPAEEDSSSPSDDSGDDSEDSSVHTDQLESSSKSSSGDESEGEMHDEAAGWTTKNGKIVWSPTNAETLHYFPAATGLIPGPTHYAAARIIDASSSFMLFLTDEIVQHIVAMTNLHGRRTMKAWRDVDVDEIRAYVGLIVLAGVYQSKHESTISLWSEKSGRSIFRATMSHKRFCYISRAMRFDDKLSRPRRQDDKLAAFCQQLVPFKGRCGFRQYMPKKTAKYGIKIWAACDAKTSYAWRLQVYTGKAELLKRKLALVGTIRQNKPEIPPALRQARGREIYSSTFAFTKKHTLVSYIPRRGKNVLLLSTKHRSPDVTDEDKRKPMIIEEYNRCKGGVDNLDKVVGTYTCRKRTSRWPMALFHNMIDVSLYNAYVLWISVDPSWQQQKSHRRRLYIEEVGESLVKPHMMKRGRLPRSSAAAEMVTAERDAAAAGPSVSIQSRDRKKCEFCCDRK
ncbi:serine carboxypeptidase 1 [Sarotherodon galilaeus]